MFSLMLLLLLMVVMTMTVGGVDGARVLSGECETELLQTKYVFICEHLFKD